MFEKFVIGNSPFNLLDIEFDGFITNVYDWTKTSEVFFEISRVYYNYPKSPTIFDDYYSAKKALEELKTNYENIKFKNSNIFGQIIDDKNGFKFDVSKLKIYELVPTEVNEQNYQHYESANEDYFECRNHYEDGDWC